MTQPINRLPYPATHDQAVALKKGFAKARGIEKMHIAYGPHPPDHCGDCLHFLVREASRNYFKCALYGVTRGAATDWQKRLEACGKFERREED
jgi:hypothetical protein